MRLHRRSRVSRSLSSGRPLRAGPVGSPGLQNNERKRRMRNAVRRRPILRNSRCGAHPAGRARLPAFHRGSSLGTHASQGAASDQVSRSGAPRHGGVLPPAPAPVAASTSHAGHNAGRHDVRNRPGTACNSVRGRRPRPMARHASGPPPSRARTMSLPQTVTMSSTVSRKR
jgi:hypothetical protein